jgi:hypothetical protein
MLTTQKQVRAAFWQQTQWQASYRAGKKQNDYCTDIRVDFIDFVDALSRAGIISEALASRVTL